MKNFLQYIVFAVIILATGCNTLYNSRMIDIDIMEPAQVKLPDGYQNLAIRYNNANIAWNPQTAAYFSDGNEIPDSTNLDSIASKVYFDIFLATLKEQQFFNSINELDAADYSQTRIVDTLKTPEFNFSDSTLEMADYTSEIGVFSLASEIRKSKPSPSVITGKKYLDREFGLYAKTDIDAIADSTSADVLLSFDHFYTLDGLAYFSHEYTARRAVQVHYSWTGYDLKNRKLAFHFAKADTIFWSNYAELKKEALAGLPPRKDAVLNAADIAGENTANFLVPHWTTVERMIYESGNVDLKPAQQLAIEGRWLEAAELWKKNVNNPNKNIAAKCKYNMAVACEMNDELEAALNWAVESYHVFGEKNKIHAANCRDYIRILSQRKLDVSIMEQQFESKYKSQFQ